jgi:hypothetical protein
MTIDYRERLVGLASVATSGAWEAPTLDEAERPDFVLVAQEPVERFREQIDGVGSLVGCRQQSNLPSSSSIATALFSAQRARR